MATPESYLSSLETEIKSKINIGGSQSSSLDVLMKAYDIFDQDTRLLQIIQKLDNINTKLDTMNAKLTAIDTDTKANGSQLSAINSDLQTLNDQVGKLGNMIYRGGF